MAQENAPTSPLVIQRNGGKVYSPIRKMWLVETPEERVRQEYVVTLVNEYKYRLDQMGEEVDTTGLGTARARADIAIWKSPQVKTDKKTPFIIVECKSDNVTISAKDYAQGESYARFVDAPFFVTHNNRETKYWRVLKDKMPGYVQEIENIPDASASDKDIAELLKKLKTFKEDEFADLLHKCHNVIRDREKRDPADAFDEIAKILFVKMFVERELKQEKRAENRFTVDVLRSTFGEDKINALFGQTLRYFANDRLFVGESSQRINLRAPTSEEIVALLQSYNLSDTSEDVKGIAFERFLGRTFRGEMGQFFTPRPIVEFMIRMVDPQENDVICDPASGSGGFLIRAFERVREAITAQIDGEYQAFEAATNAREDLSEQQKADMLREQDDARRLALDTRERHSRLWKLSNRCLYGTDANERMARTSKMNMIMHGDGHGGVHGHDGFLNVNGIFEGRFDIIVTNPPFGANVGASDIVRREDAHVTDAERDRYEAEYGDLYRQAQAGVTAKIGRPIAELFELGRRGLREESIKDTSEGAQANARTRRAVGSVKTEILFIERCLNLLKPGGRLGIVLPEGIFNNPSLAYVRRFCEDRAYIRAVVSLPQETFTSSGASVKASLLFLQKFTESEQSAYDQTAQTARTETEAKHKPAVDAERERLDAAIESARAARESDTLKALRAELTAYNRRMEEQIQTESRALLKQRWAYPIFLYEAEKVGITATGEADANELYPNTRVPVGIEQTCLEAYRAFRQDPFGWTPSPPAR